MNSSPTATVSQGKRGRGRPKGSLNKPKHRTSSPRRNARRTSTINSLHTSSTSSSLVASGHRHNRTCVDIHTFAYNLKESFAPRIHTWSNVDRFYTATFFLEFAHLCMPSEDQVEALVQTLQTQHGPFVPPGNESAPSYRGPCVRQDGNWTNIHTIASDLKTVVSPCIPTWSIRQRFLVAVFFCEFGCACRPDQQVVDAIIASNA
ncbi:hypothetical protein CF326_g750 [Tilletia indica]|nr:hypothetical protein CF326_g750 [Tilletia indica]